MPETHESRLQKANEEQAKRIANLTNVLMIVAMAIRKDELLWHSVVDPKSGATMGKLLTGALDLEL